MGLVAIQLLGEPTMNDLFIRCDCHSLDHLICFSYSPDEPDEVYLEVHLIDYRHWWERLWRAIRYVFGRPCRYGDWDSVCISAEKTEELFHYLDEFIDANEKWVKTYTHISAEVIT